MTPPIEVPWPPMNLVAECTTMSAPHSNGRMSHGRGHRVVDDERHAVLVGHARRRPRCRGRRSWGCRCVSPKNALVLGRTAARHASRSSGSSTKVTSMPELGQRVVEEVVGAAVERGRRDDVAAGLGQVQDGERLGRLARRPRPARRGCPTAVSGAPSRAAMRASNTRLGRVHDPGVDVADLGQREQVGGVGRVAELVRGGLVDRHGPGAGGGVGLLAGVDLAGLEAPVGVAHRCSSVGGRGDATRAPAET